MAPSSTHLRITAFESRWPERPVGAAGTIVRVAPIISNSLIDIKNLLKDRQTGPLEALSTQALCLSVCTIAGWPVSL